MAMLPDPINDAAKVPFTRDEPIPEEGSSSPTVDNSPSDVALAKPGNILTGRIAALQMARDLRSRRTPVGRRSSLAGSLVRPITRHKSPGLMRRAALRPVGRGAPSLHMALAGWDTYSTAWLRPGPRWAESEETTQAYGQGTAWPGRSSSFPNSLRTGTRESPAPSGPGLHRASTIRAGRARGAAAGRSGIGRSLRQSSSGLARSYDRGARQRLAQEVRPPITDTRKWLSRELGTEDLAPQLLLGQPPSGKSAGSRLLRPALAQQPERPGSDRPLPRVAAPPAGALPTAATAPGNHSALFVERNAVSRQVRSSRQPAPDPGDKRRTAVHRSGKGNLLRRLAEKLSGKVRDNGSRVVPEILTTGQTADRKGTSSPEGTRVNQSRSDRAAAWGKALVWRRTGGYAPPRETSVSRHIAEDFGPAIASSRLTAFRTEPAGPLAESAPHLPQVRQPSALPADDSPSAPRRSRERPASPANDKGIGGEHPGSPPRGSRKANWQRPRPFDPGIKDSPISRPLGQVVGQIFSSLHRKSSIGATKTTGTLRTGNPEQPLGKPGLTKVPLERPGGVAANLTSLPLLQPMRVVQRRMNYESATSSPAHDPRTVAETSQSTTTAPPAAASRAGIRRRASLTRASTVPTPSTPRKGAEPLRNGAAAKSRRGDDSGEAPQKAGAAARSVLARIRSISPRIPLMGRGLKTPAYNPSAGGDQPASLISNGGVRRFIADRRKWLPRERGPENVKPQPLMDPPGGGAPEGGRLLGSSPPAQPGRPGGELTWQRAVFREYNQSQVIDPGEGRPSAAAIAGDSTRRSVGMRPPGGVEKVNLGDTPVKRGGIGIPVRRLGENLIRKLRRNGPGAESSIKHRTTASGDANSTPSHAVGPGFKMALVYRSAPEASQQGQNVASDPLPWNAVPEVAVKPALRLAQVQRATDQTPEDVPGLSTTSDAKEVQHSLSRFRPSRPAGRSLRRHDSDVIGNTASLGGLKRAMPTLLSWTPAAAFRAGNRSGATLTRASAGQETFTSRKGGEQSQSNTTEKLGALAPVRTRERIGAVGRPGLRRFRSLSSGKGGVGRSLHRTSASQATDIGSPSGPLSNAGVRPPIVDQRKWLPLESAPEESALQLTAEQPGARMSDGRRTLRPSLSTQQDRAFAELPVQRAAADTYNSALVMDAGDGRRGGAPIAGNAPVSESRVNQLLALERTDRRLTPGGAVGKGSLLSRLGEKLNGKLWSNGSSRDSSADHAATASPTANAGGSYTSHRRGKTTLVYRSARGVNRQASLAAADQPDQNTAPATPGLPFLRRGPGQQETVPLAGDVLATFPIMASQGRPPARKGAVLSRNAALLLKVRNLRQVSGAPGLADPKKTMPTRLSRTPTIGGRQMYRSPREAESISNGSLDPLVALLETDIHPSKEKELTLPDRHRLQAGPMPTDHAANLMPRSLSVNGARPQPAPTLVKGSPKGTFSGPSPATLFRQSAGPSGVTPWDHPLGNNQVVMMQGEATEAPVAEAASPKEEGRRFDSSDIEFLASKVYACLKRQLAIERERHGRASFPLRP